MKLKLIALAILASAYANAQPSYNISATSDYVWRGVSQTKHQTALQGGVDYEFPVGVTVGAWTSNIEDGSELDVYAKYTYKFLESYSVGVGGTWYGYTQDGHLNTGEANVSFTTPFVSLSANYTNDYFGTDTSSFYFEATQSFLLDAANKVSLIPTIGYVTFDDTEKSGSKDYLNYKIELLKEYESFNFRVFYTNTDRKSYASGVETNEDDETVGVMVSKNF